FEGCSNGGRQAMQEAERYPTDFDGIIAGAPALDWVGTMTGFVWNEQAVNAASLPVAKVALLAGAVLAECDAKDGLMDGLISDPRRCRFDPKTLQCPAGDAPTCLTAGQVEAARRIYHGATSSSGRQLYFGWPQGHEDGAATGWPFWITGNGAIPPLQFLFADGYLRYFVFPSPPNPSFDLLTSDLESDVRAMRPTGKFLNATNADLSDFSAAGGKLIMWHGWADAALTAFRSIAYLEEAAHKTKHGNRLDEFFRLFLAPGMHHCGGGPGPNTLDALSALESWVEHGIAPEQIVATHRTGTVVDRTRPLCAYPKEATYKGPGSMDDASSFVGRVPRDPSDRHDRFDNDDADVGHLRGHPDDEREIDEVPVVGLRLAARESHAAADGFVVELVGVVQREDRVDECPGQQDREGGEHDVGRPAAGPGAELGEDSAEARQRRHHRQHQDGQLPLVLHRGAVADTVDVRP